MENNDMNLKSAALSASLPKANLPQGSNEEKLADQESKILTQLVNFFTDFWGDTTIGLPIITEPDKLAQLIKTVLCSYACKELAMADVYNALACKIAVDKGLFKGACDCDCIC